MDAVLHQALLVRCRGHCECHCGAKVPPGEVDHFFGRAKAEESEATCWVLSVRCHYAKTRNSPDASTWFRRFAAHCDARADELKFNNPARRAYEDAANRARARLDFVDTRRALGSTLGTRR